MSICITLINQQTARLNRTQILGDLNEILALLQRKTIRQKVRLKRDLSLVFLDAKKMRKINKAYRGKDKVTDVLSFQTEDDTLGELLFCVPQIHKQAKQHGLSPRLELNYLVIHGLLHLLGYDHEASRKEERLMFRIQDEVFDSLCASL